MDTELTALAGTVANALVSRMTTDAWQSLLGGLKAAFRRAYPDRADDIVDQLERLRRTRESGDAVASWRAETMRQEWRERLLTLLDADPTAAVDLRRLLTVEDRADRLGGRRLPDLSETGRIIAPAPDSVRSPMLNRPLIFRGRATLRATLTGAVAAGGGVHVLYGLGGVGKSATADSVFQQAERQGLTAWWIAAGDRTELRAAMLAVAADLGADPAELKAAQDGRRAAADLVWRHLDRSARRWLLVLDNADDPGVLTDGRWLRSSAAGTVLVTTRRRDSTAWRDVGAHQHPVDVLPLDQAARVLCDLAPERGTPQEALALAERLGGLPLALTLAGGYLARQVLHSWTMTEYRDRLRDDAVALIDRGAGEGGARDILSGTWQLTLSALTDRGVPEATLLLRLLSCFGPGPLPLTVLTTPPAAGAHVTPRPHAARAPEPFLGETLTESGLRALQENCLLTPHTFPGTPARCLRVHALLQETVRSAIPADERAGYLARAAGMVDAALPNDIGPDNLSGLRLLAPHVTALLQHADPPIALLARLGTRAAELIHASGDYQAAATLAELAGDRAERLRGPDDQDTLAARHQQADSLHRLGRPREAAALLRNVHARRAAVLGKRDPDTLETARALSVTLFLLGETAESLAGMARVIDGQRRELGPTDPETLRSEALNLEFLAHTDDAEHFLRTAPSAVATCEATLGPDHPVTAVAHSNHAYGLLHFGTPEDARSAAERALAARRLHHGDDHPLTHSAQLVLGWALTLCGEHDRGTDLMRDALHGRERTLGPDHRHTLKAHVLYAERLHAAGRHAEAHRRLTRYLPLAEAAWGATDQDVRRARRLAG